MRRLLALTLFLCSCSVTAPRFRGEYGYGEPVAVANLVNAGGAGKPMDLHFSRVAFGCEVAKFGKFTTDCFVGSYAALPQAHESSVGFGGSVMPRLVYDGFDNVRPYVMVDLGMGYANWHAQGSDFDFQIGGSLGVLYPLADNWDASASYQWSHFSNAGTSDPNPGLNTDLITFGVEYKF